MWLIIILVAVGLLLLVAELVLLPGLSVAAIGAFLSLTGAAAYAYVHYGLWMGSAVLTVIIILSALTVVTSLRANTWKRLSLDATIDSTSTPTAEQRNIKIGQQGITLTRLAPMGKAIFGETTLEARTVDSYIDPRQPIEVIAFDSTVVIVKLTNSSKINE